MKCPNWRNVSTWFSSWACSIISGIRCWRLDLLRQHVAKDWFIFQSMLRGSRTVRTSRKIIRFWETAVFDKPGFPKMHFVENSYSQDPTNWWIPNRACAEAVLRSAGFRIESMPEAEVFICRCDENAYLHPLPMNPTSGWLQLTLPFSWTI